MLVNNAGTSTATPLAELTDEEWQDQWELSVMAPMRLMRAAAAVMAEAGWGRVVNVCSSSGKRPGQRNVADSVGKAAELSLSRALADAYADASAKKGVRVKAITPGPVSTELWRGARRPRRPGGVGPGFDARRGARGDGRGVPIGRLGEPEELAKVIVFLASGAASNITDAAWSVDGGLVAVII